MKLKVSFALLFIFAGLLHFLKTDVYMKAVPFWVPWPEAAVLFSGTAGAVLGAALLIPRFSKNAAWGLLLFLAAVFPANLHMALHPEIFPQIPGWVLWARLPLQAALMAWAYCYTGRPLFSKIDKRD